MCNTTKQKIAATMREMMAKKSFDKITVKTLMDATNMKRQSFYYHFQDTRDVLMWICREELFFPLEESQLEFSEWMLYGLSLLDRDRNFYRRVIAAAQMDFVRELCDRTVTKRVRELLYPGEQLDENQCFAVEFVSNAVADYFLRFVSSYQVLELMDCRKKLRFLVSELRG
jgi:AcrR family transcriptional regulator